MIRRIRKYLPRAHGSIRWKLTIWISLLLGALFIVYNIVQYFVINEWLIVQEKQNIEKSMNEIESYLQEKEVSAAQIADNRSLITKLNQENQMIRILDQKGTALLEVTKGLPEQWVEPQTVKKRILITAWHYEDHLLIMRSPLITTNFSGTIEIVTNLENTDKLSDMLTLVMFAGGIAAVGLSILGAFLLSRQFVKPIMTMNATMIQIQQKGLHERVNVPNQHDELSNLARMFNRLMDELELSFQQQKQFVEDASHELRTPVAIIEGHISLLNRWGKHDPDILNESLDVSAQELKRLKTILNELLMLSQSESGHIAVEAAVDLHQTVQHALTNVVQLHPDTTFDIDLEHLSGIEVEILPQHLEQILRILVDNAVKYSPLTKEIRVCGMQRANDVSIQVSDKGMGIPIADLPYVFDRFYRVDKARTREQGGTGLGLAIAERLVKRYNGKIFIDSREDEGTTVTILLPVYPPSE
ncbi:HAMP domain-containing histidine kinase [Paenibacillus sp. F6_3S_P_1C]|uniref:Signal transduction histidine-protein kinase ArlS n=1 Tax=Paenibacillus vandeheii TaxID=3035917 RepID=A0ABT8JI07_9BACL|nr:HAMP domain-containing histidine kinase [Paenibacillus vandeheii]MDN4604680.1 HAMP domain-containing histidine kinase [Paenibacillus vandeheii]